MFLRNRSKCPFVAISSSGLRKLYAVSGMNNIEGMSGAQVKQGGDNTKNQNKNTQISVIIAYKTQSLTNIHISRGFGLVRLRNHGRLLLLHG